MNLTEINQFLPWFVIVLQFIGFCWIILKQINVIHDNTLAKAPSSVAPKVPDVVAQSPAPKPCPPITPPVSTPTSEAITPGFINFVKKEEGFSAKAYPDNHQWSIGYGTKATNPSEVITEAEAVVRLDHEIGVADTLVTKKFPNLPKGVHQALTDLTYNAGSSWEMHTLGAAVAAQKWDTVKADILLYNHSAGQVNSGLTARREAEVSWFDNPL